MYLSNQWSLSTHVTSQARGNLQEFSCMFRQTRDDHDRQRWRVSTIVCCCSWSKQSLMGSKLLKPSAMCVGHKARGIIKSKKDDSVVQTLLECIQIVYTSCASNMQQKLLLTNPLLLGISSIDPPMLKHSKVMQLLKQLPTFLLSNLTQDEKEKVLRWN